VKPLSNKAFDLDCTACPRLAKHLRAVRIRYPDYHAAPVPPFGAARSALLVVGLAPGMHGANATGRAFTGDHAGILLYQMLHKHGFANKAEATHLGDGLKLTGARISNAVKCLPPENKPTTEEVATCNHFLAADLANLPRGAVMLALGGVAHRAILRARALKQKTYPFGHGCEYTLEDGRRLLDSYHCSRYNTQTRRLTTEMFDTVIARARQLVDEVK
jgi:uracil-DNA glycosylase family 4